jgi:hypothetical protein
MPRSRPVTMRDAVRVAAGVLLLVPLARGASIDAAITLEPDRAVEGQTVALTLTLRSEAVRLGQRIEIQELPPRERLDIGPFRELPVQRIGGPAGQEVRRYRARAVARQAGTLTFRPAVRVSVLTRRGFFFGGVWDETPHTVRPAPVTLTVRPLPDAGRPEAFSGAVGTFTLEARAEPTDLALGDLVTLTVTVRGDGNLDGLDPPQPMTTNGFRFYAPREVAAPEGARRFEQVLVPLDAGATAIPEIRLTFFDPVADAYRSVRQEPIPLRFHDRLAEPFERFRPDDAPAEASSDAPPGGARGTTVRAETPARLGPRRAGLVTFTIPAGTPVRILETAGSWIKVDAGGARGWIPAETVSAP